MMEEKLTKQVENSNLPVESTSIDIGKVIKNTENVCEKHTRYRGRDKRPRKISANSLRNLKPLQAIQDVNKLYQFIKNPYQKPASGSKIWIAILIFLVIIFCLVVGYLVWRHYKEKQIQSLVSDNLSSILEGGGNNGQA